MVCGRFRLYLIFTLVFAEVGCCLFAAYSLTQPHDVASHMSLEGLQITSCKSSPHQDQAVGIYLPGCLVFTLPVTPAVGVVLEPKMPAKLSVLLRIFM
jgi:hypothetical protein